MNDRVRTFTTTSADGPALKRIRQELGSFARRIDPMGPLADDVETIVAEILDNIRAHSPGDNRVTVRAREGSTVLELEFRDGGVPFDPLRADIPDLDLRISERDTGGLGIHLVRNLANGLQYCRSPEGENILTVQLSLRPGSRRERGSQK